MALQIIVKVVPSSGRATWGIDKSGNLKVYLKSEPEKGRANQELVAMFAKALRIAQQDVVILAGHTARLKRVQISLDLSYDELLKQLGIEKEEKQQTLF